MLRQNSKLRSRFSSRKIASIVQGRVAFQVNMNASNHGERIPILQLDWVLVYMLSWVNIYSGTGYNWCCFRRGRWPNILPHKTDRRRSSRSFATCLNGTSRPSTHLQHCFWHKPHSKYDYRDALPLQNMGHTYKRNNVNRDPSHCLSAWMVASMHFWYLAQNQERISTQRFKEKHPTEQNHCLSPFEPTVMEPKTLLDRAHNFRHAMPNLVKKIKSPNILNSPDYEN